jgi:hypothetical protein
MSETRPWIGAYLTVAELRTTKRLRVVDCVPSLVEDLNEITFSETTVWAHINYAFSEPVTSTENAADYAPTQVLAEAFRVHGFDGIQYGSRVGEGESVALFDLEAADVVSRCLCKVVGHRQAFTDIRSVTKKRRSRNS